MWTDERVAELKRLWNDGKTGSQIAKEFALAEPLTGWTRNMIISKLHRLPVDQRGAIATHSVKPKALKPRRPPILAARMAAAEAEPDPGIGTISILELNQRTCRWPFGDGPFTYCGATPFGNGPYCARHAIRAHQGAPKT